MSVMALRKCCRRRTIFFPVHGSVVMVACLDTMKSVQTNNVWMTLLILGGFLQNNYAKKKQMLKALERYC